MSDVDDGYVTTVVTEVWSELRPAFEHRQTRAHRVRRRRRRTLGLGLGIAVIGVGGTAGALSLLGDPAPPVVQESIAGIDEGMPADLRLQPDVSNARSVARDGDAVLYAADLPDGGACTEIAVAGKPSGVTCHRAGDRRQPIEASIPGTPEDGADARVVVGGRVPVEADAADVVLAGARRVPIALAPGGYFVVALGATDSTAARLGGLVVEARAGSMVLSSADLSDAFTLEPGPTEALSVEYVSGPGDLSKVVSISGDVRIDGATVVRLVYPDGTATDGTIGADQHYEVVLPTDRQAALADAPGTLVVLDDSGHQLASRFVAAVSFWHAHEG